jgi:prepilin-type processing-associated H-X9-DG protein
MTKLPKFFSRQTAGCGRATFLLKSSPSSGGFTLMELIVVVGIVIVLVGLLLPAVSRSKSRARAIVCMNNSRQMAFAWTMYSDANNDRLAYNLGNSAQLHTSTLQSYPANPNWVNNIMDWELSPDNTNLNFVNQSLIAPLASFSTSIFHCPADNALSAVQQAAGWTGRVRSVAMNAMVGDPGSLLQDGVKLDNPGFEQFIRDTDFPDASSIFVFLDEHPDSIDDGYFLNTRDTGQWLDLPASAHNGGGSFSFADGHTEIHRWRNPDTVRPAVPEGAGLPFAVVPGQSEDFDWVIKHTSVPIN